MQKQEKGSRKNQSGISISSGAFGGDTSVTSQPVRNSKAVTICAVKWSSVQTAREFLDLVEMMTDIAKCGADRDGVAVSVGD